jgi:hypothetical protein
MLGLALLVLAAWTRQSRWFLVAWFIGGAAAILPGFYFRPHYFILLMPVVGVLVGFAFASLEGLLARGLGAVAARAAILAAFAVFLGAHVQRTSHEFFAMTETELVRSVYTDNPFLEAPEIGRYLAARTNPDDRIAVLGSEPEILFYAGRLSATGYIYMYPLMEPQPYAARMRDELRREVEAAQPAYVVVSGVPASWGARPGSDLRILEWANQFAAACFDMVGVAEVDPRQGPAVRWDPDLAGYQPRSDSRISVFRRKPGGPCRVPGLP